MKNKIMVHFLLRMAMFDFAFIGVHLRHTFSGRFEEAIAAFAFAWLVDPAMKKASPYIYSGWLSLSEWAKK
jgi:hypothetical protein